VHREKAMSKRTSADAQDEDAPSPRKRWNIPALLLTGLISAVFTVAAGYLTYRLTNREPKLQYDLSEGPPLSSVGLTRRIYVLRVSNTGRREVEEVFIGISLSGGTFADIALARSAGFQMTENRDSSSYQLRAPFLNPRDTVAISFLSASASSVMPDIAVRGRGVLGQERKQAGERSDENILPVLFTAAFGGLGAMVGILTLVKGLRRPPSLEVSGRVTTEREDRRYIIAYAFGRAGLTDLGIRITFGGPTITYRAAADLLFLGAEAGNYPKANVVAAVTAMLTVPWLNAETRILMQRGLRALGVDASLIDTGPLNRTATSTDLRERMDVLIADVLAKRQT
jgi:hypothetical protein